MALAGVQAVMDLGDKKTLHPFFSKAQRIPSPERSIPSSVPNLQGSDRDHDYESTDADLKPDNDRKPEVIKNGKRKGKNKPISGKSGQASLEKFTRQNNNGYVVVGEEAQTLDEDLNMDRRKRRKTTPLAEPLSLPPDALIELDTDGPITASLQPSWHEQLEFEATKGSEKVLVEASSPRSAAPDLPGPPDVIPTTPPMSRQNEDALVKPPYSPPAINCPGLIEPQPAEAEDATNKTTSESALPQKKLLMLNGNGKFSSPVAKTHGDQSDEATKRTKNKKKSKKTLISSIVVIKYGSDAASRSHVGNQIDQIIRGTARKENTKIELPKRPSKSADPPKATHPFFLGKPSQRKEESAPPITSSGPSHVSKYPKKSAVTPGKLRAQARSMHSIGTSLPFGSVTGDSKILKHPGMSEAPWPWRGIAHVRNLNDIRKDRAQPCSSTCSYSDRLQKARKLKKSAVIMPAHEDLIEKIAYQLKPFLSTKVDEDDNPQESTAFLRLPTRLLTTGVTLQRMIQKELRARFQKVNSHSLDLSEGEIAELQNNTHPVLNGLFRGIEDTLTPFDKGECETQTWTQKYAPTCAADVLQLGKEAIVIRDWLKSLSVIAIDSGKDSGKAKDRPASKQKPAKKKRKKTDELDDFIVASDEDDEMDELTDPEDLAPIESRHTSKKSLVRMGEQTNTDSARSKRQKNVVLLSGPHGCGKTAIVYAVAKEMGFEVFEINSSSRRSGKDVLDKVGDMSENHLVNHRPNESNSPITESRIDSDEEESTDTLQRDLESGRQGTMTSFFKPAVNSKNPKAKPLFKVLQKDENTMKPKSQRPQHHQHNQKQSLILLEEVDVLFEEDKQFWVTILTLAIQSKRPIIMTCNDENLVQLNALPLHAILRISPPPVDLATDYLLLIAAKEGHILDRDSVSNLYKSKDHDLRASITDLDFWCQMSIGDRKGGLEWTYQRWPPGKDVDEYGQVIRVASKGTYQSGMGWFSHDILKSGGLIGFDKEEELFLETWNSWGVPPESWSSNILPMDSIEASASFSKDPSPKIDTSPIDRLDALKRTELLLDCVSAADIYCRVGLPSGSMETMDTTQPPLPEKARFNYTDAYILLPVDPAQEFSNFDTSIAVQSHLGAQRYATGVQSLLSSYNPSSHLSATKLDKFTSGVLDHKTRQWAQTQLSRVDFSQAFDLLAEPPTTSLLHASPNQLTASSFDRNFRIITEDLAPYVRNIVAHDLRLEADRVRMSSLLSEGGKNKRMRTTRASRSALEGGRRETKRRERWFDNEINMTLVMRTAGKSWTGKGLKLEDTEIEELESIGSIKSVDED
ncbi:hypothetical protein AOQ84DRAFT_325113 [Glonium stellatum]|uniref:AAA+ ATPase domain-containing protein n=1 Tax=Glonium stellatum TaxID=574774 RepID=A0A8E2ESA1_9PEZI|nr:hypothetical protein AOQ84DRAFT_325113 [Glonium stellatum]